MGGRDPATRDRGAAGRTNADGPGRASELDLPVLSGVTRGAATVRARVLTLLAVMGPSRSAGASALPTGAPLGYSVPEP